VTAEPRLLKDTMSLLNMSVLCTFFSLLV
jgi:hypothetical protein